MLPLFEPLNNVSRYRVPPNRWRHYERWATPIAGFVALGDASCVFNPNQGQGMSTAATDAQLLRRCALETTDPVELPRRFFAELSRFQQSPWRLAVGNDLRFPSVDGPRPVQVRAFNWYRAQLARSTSRRVRQHIGQIDSLLEPVGHMYAPLPALFAGANLVRNLVPFGREDWDPFGPIPPGLPPVRLADHDTPRPTARRRRSLLNLATVARRRPGAGSPLGVGVVRPSPPRGGVVGDPAPHR
jgi:hypothetical protein